MFISSKKGFGVRSCVLLSCLLSVKCGKDSSSHMKEEPLLLTQPDAAGDISVSVIVQSDEEEKYDNNDREIGKEEEHMSIFDFIRKKKRRYNKNK